MNENPSMRIPATRIRMTYLIIIVILLVFIGRLFSLQIIQGEAYRKTADDNRFDEVSLPAQRGVIYDRNDFQLVRNIPEYRVMVTPALLPDSQAEQELIYKRISDLTGVPLDQEGPPAAPCVPGRGVPWPRRHRPGVRGRDRPRDCGAPPSPGCLQNESRPFSTPESGHKAHGN